MEEAFQWELQEGLSMEEALRWEQQEVDLQEGLRLQEVVEEALRREVQDGMVEARAEIEWEEALHLAITPGAEVRREEEVWLTLDRSLNLAVG